MDLDLDALTARALDLPALLDALASRCLTGRGREVALAAWPVRDLEVIGRWLHEVAAARGLNEVYGGIPLGGVDDVAPEVSRAAKGGVLDVGELRHVGHVLDVLLNLGRWLSDRDDETGPLNVYVGPLSVDAGLVAELRGAFDEQGRLSGRRWPILAELRDRLADLHVAVRRRLDELVKGEELGDALQDRFVTQRSERYVLPIKANHDRKRIGIVHAMSASGHTAFVEPHEVVALNNELRIAQGELEAEERRILTELSRLVGADAPSIQRALDAATDVDLASARAVLSHDLGGVRPHVGTEGILRLDAARHPLLVLRGVDVVPNDLALDRGAPMLVVSGPNTGGKTVALKTIGLAALLVRLGCWVPAAEGARVDLFPEVLAVVGDHQSVAGDQSSFSSHLAALTEMVRRAGPGCLFLVDEIASGTDPEQGSALAHALVEYLLERGVRGVITTHFQRLKTLGAQDPRVAIAGMQFANGRPTWRMVRGSSGESHALETAARLGMPGVLVERARALMDAGERDLVDALAALDAERERAATATAQADAARLELATTRASLAAEQERLAKRAKELEAQASAAFRDRLSAAERAIGAVVAELQRSPSQEGARSARQSMEALRSLVPEPEVVQAPSERVWLVGDRVVVPHLRERGEVVGTGKQIQVRTDRGLVLRVSAAELQAAAPSAPSATPLRAKRAGSEGKGTLDRAVRNEENAIDLRGQRVEEGLAELERAFDQALRQHRNVLFVLHGHGSGAMKQAVRQWLPTCSVVAGWKPGSADQGGDAWTVVELS